MFNDELTLRKETLSWHNNKEQLRILHLSDLHLKWTGRHVKAIENYISGLIPDIIVLTGDYYDTPRGGRLFCEFVERISQKSPVYWIRGNHDGWFGLTYINRLHHLKNTYCVDDYPCAFTSSAGFHYQIVSWAQHTAATEHILRDNERRIVLLHNPEDIIASRLEGCDLVLTGHLHGGQFVLHVCQDRSFFPGNILYRWCCDRREVGASTVIVSRGIGDTLPLRFRCPKEVVCLQIR